MIWVRTQNGKRFVECSEFEGVYLRPQNQKAIAFIRNQTNEKLGTYETWKEVEEILNRFQSHLISKSHLPFIMDKEN